MASAELKAKPASDAKPVWIWDPDRQRILWANAAGLAFWGEESLLDLVEKDFAPNSSTVVEFARQRELVLRQPSSELRLVLTPKGAPVRTTCKFSAHPLPDGRLGLRVEAEIAEPGEQAEVERLREILARAPVAVSLFSEDGTLLMQNAAADQMFGAAAQASLARRYGERDAARNALRSVLVNGAFSHATELETAYGRRRHRVTMRRMQDPVTGGLAALMFFTDISDREAAEAATTSAPPMGRGNDAAVLLREADSGIVVVNADLRVLFINPAAQAMLGLEDGGALESAFGREGERLRALIAAQPTSAQRIDLPTRPQDSATRWLSVILRPVVWHGEAAFLLSMADVTGERRALIRLKIEEEERSRALEAIGVGMLFVDATGAIQEVSNRAAEILGGSPESLKGRSLASLLEDVGGKKLEAYLDQGPIVAGRAFEQGTDVSLRHKAERVRLVFAPATRRNRNWRCVAIRPVEAPVPAPQAEPQMLARAEMLGKVSHELRTPLNAILGFVEIIQADPKAMNNPRHREYLDDILDSGRHMSRLLDDLLDLRRVEAGAADLRFEPIDMTDLVERIVRQSQPAAEARQVVLRLDVQPDVPMVRGDAHTLRQAIGNLISNAIKYVDPGGLVSVSIAQEDDGALSVEVADDGQGMTPEELQIALSPFGRLERHRNTAKGSGLGLPLSKALAEANQAQFAIDSRKGVGTVARLVFPTERLI